VRTDPCDGVNAYAFIAIAFISVASVLRMLRGRHPSLSTKHLYSVRSQQGVLFAIFITFAAEIIALARNVAAWNRIVSPSWLFTSLAALATLTVILQLLIFLRQQTGISEPFAMDAHHLACGCCADNSRFLSGVANV
jgi:hypothetical protein